MINKDSIVTAYDEHLTLVEWLQKVENALNTSVLTNLGIAKLSDKDNVATYQVTATFADNTTIASDSFTLPSTDIVIAFNNLATLVKSFDTRIATNTANVNSILDIIDIAGEKINPDVLKNSINGDDDVIVEVDNDEGNEKLGIHLSPELQAKLARVLLKPSSAPTTRKVVTIATNGAQDNIDGTELTTLMSNIVDSHGNKRFVEGTGTTVLTSGQADIAFCKWSLSGSHIMFVMAGTIKANATITGGSWLANYVVPQWIADKIIPVWDKANIEMKDIRLYADDWTNVTVSAMLTKTGRTVHIINTGAINNSEKNRSFRIQFDLLIDSD